MCIESYAQSAAERSGDHRHKAVLSLRDRLQPVHQTLKEAFTRTRDLLSAVRCRLLGVVLNAVDSNAPDYYYSYRYYPYAYGYGYGEEEGKHSHFPSGRDDKNTPST